MTYPLYWNLDGNTYWLGTGGPIIDATLAVCENDNIVEFYFYDGNRRYSNKREFSNSNRAKNFAIRFGRLMRKLDRQNSVPTLATFDEF